MARYRGSNRFLSSVMRLVMMSGNLNRLNHILTPKMKIGPANFCFSVNPANPLHSRSYELPQTRRRITNSKQEESETPDAKSGELIQFWGTTDVLDFDLTDLRSVITGLFNGIYILAFTIRLENTAEAVRVDFLS